MPRVLCYPCGSTSCLYLSCRFDPFFQAPLRKRRPLRSMLCACPWKLDNYPFLRHSRPEPENFSCCRSHNSFSDNANDELVSVSERWDGSIIFSFGAASKIGKDIESETKIQPHDDAMKQKCFETTSTFAYKEVRLEVDHDQSHKQVATAEYNKGSDRHAFEIDRLMPEDSLMETTLEDNDFGEGLNVRVAEHDLEKSSITIDRNPDTLSSMHDVGKRGAATSDVVSAASDASLILNSSEENYLGGVSASFMSHLCTELSISDFSEAEAPKNIVLTKEEDIIEPEFESQIVVGKVEDGFPLSNAQYEITQEGELDSKENLTLNVGSHIHATNVVNDFSLTSMKEEGTFEGNKDIKYDADDKTGAAGVENLPMPTILVKEAFPASVDVSAAGDILNRQQLPLSDIDCVTDSPVTKKISMEDFASGSIVHMEDISHGLQCVTVASVATERLKVWEQARSSGMVENVSKVCSSVYQDSLLPVVTSFIDSENLTPEFFLESGTAAISLSPKALSGGSDFSFTTPKWIGVVDGAHDWSLEGSNAGFYAREVMEYCEQLLLDRNDVQVRSPVDLLSKAAAKTKALGLCAVVVANIQDQVLHAANIGNTGFCIVRNGIIAQRSSPMLLDFNFPIQLARGDDPATLAEEFEFVLEEDDVIILASNGLFDNLYDEELTSIVTKLCHATSKPQHIAEVLAEAAHKMGQMHSGRTPFADSAQAAGYQGYSGGYLDDVTVVVSVVHKRSSTTTSVS